MMRIYNLSFLLILLAYYGMPTNAQERHHHGHHHVHYVHFGGGVRHLAQAAPSPGPSGLWSSPTHTSLPTANNTANMTALTLGVGFKQFIKAIVPRTANQSGLGNASQCGSAVQGPEMLLVKSMFMDLLSQTMPADAISNITYLTKWRDRLKDKLAMLKLYGSMKTIAKEYFNVSMPSDLDKVLDVLSKLPALPTRRALMQLMRPASFTVPLYVVVASDPILGVGQSVALSSVQEQVAYLNDKFSETGFSFELTGEVYAVADAAYFRAPDGSELDFARKRQLRRGGPEALNVYIRSPTAEEILEPGEILLGVARFPEMMCSNGQINNLRVVDDGISILYQTLPDQGYLGFLGATLVHEVGHWLGLAHTFNQPSSCDPSNGDSVGETPVEGVPYMQNPDYVPGTCNTQSDSCPALVGVDPITNWMDYSPDKCYTSFTPEQITIMQANYYNIRLNKRCSFPGQVSPFEGIINGAPESGGTPGVGGTPPTAATPTGGTTGLGSNSAISWSSNNLHSMMLTLTTVLALSFSIF